MSMRHGGEGSVSRAEPFVGRSIHGLGLFQRGKMAAIRHGDKPRAGNAGRDLLRRRSRFVANRTGVGPRLALYSSPGTGTSGREFAICLTGRPFD